MSKLSSLLILNGAIADFLIILFYLPQIGIVISGFSSSLWILIFLLGSNAYFIGETLYIFESTTLSLYASKGLIGNWSRAIIVGCLGWNIGTLLLVFTTNLWLASTATTLAVVSGMLTVRAVNRVFEKKIYYEGKGRRPPSVFH